MAAATTVIAGVGLAISAGSTAMSFAQAAQQQKNIRTAASSSLYGPYSPPSGPITGNYWAEGPTSIKTGNKWIVYFDRYVDHKMGAVMSDDLKTWTDISDMISFPEGARHGTVFIADEKILETLLRISR